MYQPAHFEQADPASLQALMREHPLALLTRVAADGSLCADPVPLLYDAQASRLRGHVARANPLWHESDGQPVLAIFQGPQAYVSPSWYATKREHGKVVPTWNYTIVQAHGRLRAIDDAAWLRSFLEELTLSREGSRAQPWAVQDAPADFIDQTIKAIVGIEIEVQRLEGKWKLSQNRSAADREGVVAGLRADGLEAAADRVAHPKR